MRDDDHSLPHRLALDLYATVLEGGAIDRPLAAIATAVGADTAWISRFPGSGGPPDVGARFNHHNFDPADMATYTSEWMAQDNWLHAGLTQPPGVLNLEPFVPQAELLRSAFWNDFVKRCAAPVQHVLAASVDVPADMTGILALQRFGRTGAFGAEEERLLRALYPHLARAMVAEARLAEAGMRGAMLGAGLDALTQGIALLGADGRLMHANAPLLAYVARGDGLMMTAFGPASTDPAAQTRLRGRVSLALAAVTGRVRVLPEAASVALPRPSGGLPWMVQVLPLRPGLQGPFAGVQGVAVLVTDRRGKRLPGAFLLQSVLDLTAAEASLALALAGGRTLAEQAKRRRVSVETLRTQLASIRRKTGCARQADLVALVLALGG